MSPLRSKVTTVGRQAQEEREHPWTPVNRERAASTALRAYAKMATSADKGAVRQVD